MGAPNIYTLRGLLKAADGSTQVGLPDGRWVPARPLGFYSIANRCRAAWLAFIGKADVVIWPEDERQPAQSKEPGA